MISVLHPTARPEAAIRCFEEWKSKADRFHEVEWLFGIDEADAPRFLPLFKHLYATQDQFMPSLVHGVANLGPRSCISAMNACAKQAKGDILILTADDVGCPEHWDTLLQEVIPDTTKDVFVKFGDGQTSELCPHPVISRARYQKLGYFFHPDFEPFHGFGDEDATLRAIKDGSIIYRPDIIFEHRHPAFGKASWDDIYFRATQDKGAQEALWKHHPEKGPNQ